MPKSIGLQCQPDHFFTPQSKSFREEMKTQEIATLTDTDTTPEQASNFAFLSLGSMPQRKSLWPLFRLSQESTTNWTSELAAQLAWKVQTMKKTLKKIAPSIMWVHIFPFFIYLGDRSPVILCYVTLNSIKYFETTVSFWCGESRRLNWWSLILGSRCNNRAM